MSAAVDEALVEAAALEWFAGLGYGVAHGLAPDVERPDAERRSYGDVVLVERLCAAIARELVESIRNTVSIDWTVKESVRARLRAMVKRLLRKHGYPPDRQEQAVKTILEQTEALARDWAA